MSTKTKIEWTDATWNPLRGCSRKSPGCMNCYAERQAIRQAAPGKPYHGLVHIANGHPQWTGVVRFDEKKLLDPLKWRQPHRVFVNSMSDLFHETVPDETIDKIFAVMALCPQHTFQVLTKRPERMREYFKPYDRLDLRSAFIGRWAGLWHQERTGIPVFQWSGLPMPNVWLGTSVENQEWADKRIPHLLETPAAVRFISAEPLLGPLNLLVPDLRRENVKVDALYGSYGLDWVIAGGESGPGARPAHPDWFRSLRDQCEKTSKAFFFKQWGAWVKYVDRDVEDPDWRQDYTRMNRSDSFRILNLAGGQGFHGERVHVMQRVGKKAAGSLLDERTWHEYPTTNIALENEAPQ
jgi:protein gp37